MPVADMPRQTHRIGAGDLEQGFSAAAMTSMIMPAFEFERIPVFSAIPYAPGSTRKPRL